ncbi:MAG: ABC transporter substrate-binding protein [Gemmobacter sp.]|nr:ABC transporter substrate-binding protein [Gemmobacter sp.]
MNDDLAKLLAFVDKGGLGRRAFLGRTAAFGLTAALGTTLLPQGLKAQEAKKGGVVKLGLQGGESTDTLDPGLANAPAKNNVVRQWGDTIVEVAPDKALVPRLAESFEGSADSVTWTFRIRKGVKFHDGSEMTPEDVAATYRRHSDENSKSGAFGIMEGIKEITVDGDNVVITLKSGNSDLPYLLADYHLQIQPKGGMDNPDAGIGTGPYKLVSFEPGLRYVFERFADHWDPARGHYDGVEVLVINDTTARTAALQSGQVHAINRVDPKVAKLLSRAPGVQVKSIPGPGHYVFIMQVDKPPFDNKELRLALKYAINRQEMVDKILDGFGTVGNDFPINASYPLFDESLPQREFSLEKAAEHYKASGHDGSPIELYVAEGAFPGAVDAAALFQASAQQAGIPLEVMRVPDDGYWADVWNVKPFCASYWSGRPVQDQMYSVPYLSNAEWNDTRFRNQEFDDLIIAARAELDEAKRKEMYSQAAMILREEGGVIVPMFNDSVDAISEGIAGWIDDPQMELMNGFLTQKTWFA